MVLPITLTVPFFVPLSLSQLGKVEAMKVNAVIGHDDNGFFVQLKPTRLQQKALRELGIPVDFLTGTLDGTPEQYEDEIDVTVEAGVVTTTVQMGTPLVTRYDLDSLVCPGSNATEPKEPPVITEPVIETDPLITEQPK
jgi:ABC-type sugar transport system substrate-binding protein